MTRSPKSSRPAKRTARLERMLRSRREELLGVLEKQFGKQLGGDVLAAIDEQIEIGDRSVTILGQDVEFGVLELKRRQVREIDEALARLKAGEYGSCEDCGAEIDEERLEILPVATQCVDCKRRREAEKKQIEGTGRGFQSGFRDVREEYEEEE